MEENGEGTSLEAMSILVLEDQFLIAMDTEQTLRRLGAADVRLASTVEQALRILDSFAPDAAVLDLVVGGGTSEPVAQMLGASKVPFVFVTGHSDNRLIPAPLRHVPLLRKPFGAAELAAELARALKP